MGKGGTGGHDVVDEKDGAATHPFGTFHGEGVFEIALPGVAGEAGLMFGVVDSKKRAAVYATIQPPGERDCEQGALVVAALSFTDGMQGNRHNDVDGGEIQFRANPPSRRSTRSSQSQIAFRNLKS